MNDIDIRIEGRAGRITLNRPKALNALTYAMIRAIEAALDDWRDDTDVSLLFIDAIGDKAFCAGGDIADLYAAGKAGDFAYGQKFWRDEYRMNAKLAQYPKPVVSFLQGFTMGGGVGVGCHASHRIVSETSVIAMPECGIGLVPDVGGSLILARAPGYLGCYLGTTTTRLTGADAIYAGFADHIIDEPHWADLKSNLIKTGDHACLLKAASKDPENAASIRTLQNLIDRHFDQPTLSDILTSLRAVSHDYPVEKSFADETLKSMAHNSPISMACTVKMMQQLRTPGTTIQAAFDLEYRFTHRAMQHGDFIEGIRAAIIDKDRKPQWKHTLESVTQLDVTRMLAPVTQETTP